MAMRILFLLLVAAGMSACSTLPHNSREVQWAYFEDWDLDKNSKLDAGEFARGYQKNNFFQTWAGKKKSISNKQLVEKLSASPTNLKKSLYASLVKDTAASNRNDATDSRSTPANDALPFFVENSDQNNNGNIDAQEWGQAMYKVADENSDLTVSPLEFYLWQLLRG